MVDIGAEFAIPPFGLVEKLVSAEMVEFGLVSLHRSLSADLQPSNWRVRLR